MRHGKEEESVLTEMISWTSVMMPFISGEQPRINSYLEWEFRNLHVTIIRLLKRARAQSILKLRRVKLILERGEFFSQLFLLCSGTLLTMTMSRLGPKWSGRIFLESSSSEMPSNRSILLRGLTGIGTGLPSGPICRHFRFLASCAACAAAIAKGSPL